MARGTRYSQALADNLNTSFLCHNRNLLLVGDTGIE